MNRRDVLKATAVASGALLAAGRDTSAQAGGGSSARPLKLKYSVQPGWFSDLGPIAVRLERIKAEGFRAVENNGYKRMAPEAMKAYGAKLAELGIEHGIFVANRGVNGGAGVVDPKEHPAFLEEIKSSIELGKHINVKFVTITTGNVVPRLMRSDMRLSTVRGMRHNVIEGLKRGGELLAAAGVTGVVEPLNIKVNHPGYYLVRSDEAYEVMKAVDNPHIKILFDVYHQQITEGNLIDNIRQFWDEIGYFQFADVPGRHEPYTGEVNYRNVFKAIWELQQKDGRDLFVGAELGPSKGGKTEGTLAVFDAIRKADDFETA